MNVVAESEEKYRRVHKLIDIVLACIGWYMLWGAANVGLKEYKELNAINTLVSFMIPIVIYNFNLAVGIWTGDIF